MNLVLLGGRSAEKIKEIIQQNMDNVDVTIFSSMGEFVEISNLRSMEVDRVILLQDALLKENDLPKKLQTFNDYFCSWYPASRLITLVKDQNLHNLCKEVFLSPFMAHLCMDRMKSVVVLDLVQQPIDVIKKRYGDDTKTKTTSEVMEEVVDINKENAPSDKEKESKPEPKRKGFLSSLFRKGKDKKNAEISNIPQSTSPAGAVSVDNSEELSGELAGLDEQPQVESISDESYLVGAEIENKPVEDTFGQDNIKISLFQEGTGGVDVGLGVSLKDLDELEKGITSTPSEFDDLDFGGFEEENKGSDNIEVQEGDGFEENKVSDNTEEQYDADFEEDGRDKEEPEFDLDFDQEHEEASLSLDLSAQTARLRELRDSVFSRDINVSLDGVEIPAVSLPEDKELTTVNVEEPSFVDLDKLAETYEERNTKVVEKVVERVVEVEKIVKVGDNKRRYKNGIRVVILTGDRKTGMTRLALNMASHYTKSSRTLFVDFDIHRKGSLLYLGLEKVALEDERVQNGLLLLRSTNTLKHVVYPFSKGGFDCLLSMHGAEFDEKQLYEAQKVLYLQREYQTVIVDCPFENLHYLQDLILYAEVLICTESNLQGVMNTLLGLNKIPDERFLSFVYNNGQYFLSVASDMKEFKTCLTYLSDLFELGETSLDWSKLPIIGTLKDFPKVLEVL